MLIQHKGNGVGDERGDRQAGDRHQALGHACEAERRQSLPERLVERQARAERQDARHDGGEPEAESEPAPAPDRPQADEGENRGQPAEEHVLLDACADPAREEVGELGRVVPHLAERAAAARDRAGDDDLLHGDRRHRRDDRSRGSLPPVGACHPSPGVAEREHDRPHREVDLAAERDRRERDCGPDEPAPLEGQQHGREQKRDQAEQMAGRLAEPVRRQCEDESADERGAADEAERAQPPARQRTGGDDREKDDQVVGPDVPEQRPQRPERDPEQPPLQVRRRCRLRSERVRVGPRSGAVLELVPGQPERPAELEVIAGRCLSVTRSGPGQVPAVDVLHGGPGRPERARGVED